MRSGRIIEKSGTRCLLAHGTRHLGNLAVFVEHGFLFGTPGTDACIALSPRDLYSPESAIASAVIIASTFEMKEW